MKRLKLAVIPHSFPTVAEPNGGRPIYEHVRALGHWVDIEVFYFRPSYLRSAVQSGADESAAKECTREGILVHKHYFPAVRYLSRPFNGASCARRLLPLLTQYEPGAILAYFAYPHGYAAVLAGEQLRIPVMLVTVGSDLRRIPDKSTRKRTQEAVRRANSVIAVSEELRGRAISLGASSEQVHTIRNGCDRSVFVPGDRSHSREELGVPKDAAAVLFVGSMIPLKGVEQLIQASHHVLASQPKLQVFCIGEGPQKRSLVRLADRLGLSKVVHFLGTRTKCEVAQWMNACDVFCLPSHSEGCPNVIMEALTSGRPVVSTNIGGIPELIDSQCGILVPPRDPPRLASAINEALARTWDEGEIRSKQARTWSDVARETYELFESLRRRDSRGVGREGLWG